LPIGAKQDLEGFLSVAHYLDVIGELVFIQDVEHQFQVMRVILNQQQFRGVFAHTAGPFRRAWPGISIDTGATATSSISNYSV
jgi:hypothetical protein